MFSHIRALLLATGTLVLAGTVHTVSTATAGTQVAIALIPASASAPVVRSSQMRGASVRAIAIGY
ncbi:MAG TPA: hypothetical protein VHY57_03720 [Rhizomicrobium sp.]|jgi:hypothetical protein|nr:hypothetical protein [Rhizomicrobium sp.]